MRNITKIFTGAGIMLLGILMVATPTFAANSLSTASGSSASTPTHDTPQGIVTATNSPSGNELKVYDQNLNLTNTISTGGKGTGAGLGSQGGIAFRHNNLLVVNAGDNTVSSFVENSDGSLTLKDNVSSHGNTPVSVDIYENFAFVVNAGDNTVSGFKINSDGTLSYIDGSVKTLAGIAPAQISFVLDGKAIAVTEKGSNQIEVIKLNQNYLPTGSVVTASNGATPFGFKVKGNDTLVVSEAFGGTASALSTYKVNTDGTLTTISSSVHAPDQAAACWVETSLNNKYAYISNTASNSLSSYSHDNSGHVTLLNATAASTTAAPIDMTKTQNKLFVLTSNDIESFNMHSDGSLASTGNPASVAVGSYGLITLHQ